MGEALHNPSATYSDAHFATTHWSVVSAADGSATERAAEALSKLCGTYWFPLYGYVRRMGHSPHDAQDLTQGFFVQLFEKGYLHSADPGKGRFRSFLLTAMKGFLANQWDRGRRQKRGGGQPHTSLDQSDAEDRYRAEPLDETTPERAYEWRWAMTLLDNVLESLEAEFRANGRAELFAALKPWLTDDGSAVSYTQTAAALQMTESALRVAVHRLRHRYRELLRKEISHTLTDPEEIDGEIRHLFEVLSA